MNTQQYRYEQKQSERIAKGICVAQIVKVTAYDGSKQTVDVQPLVKRLEDGTYQSQPPILAVPVLCGMAGGYAQRIEYQAGDIGIVVYCDTDIDNAIDTGDEGEPNTERNHSATDAVFLGCICPGTKSNELPGDSYSLGTDDGSIALKITSDSIEITGDLTIDGDLTVNGDISATGDITAGGISLKSHTHSYDGGTTSAPQ